MCRVRKDPPLLAGVLLLCVCGVAGTASAGTAEIFSTFGPGDTYGGVPAPAVTSPSVGTQFEHAMQFTPAGPPGASYRVNTVELGLSLVTGANELTVWLMDDSGSTPGTIIETLDFNGTITGVPGTPAISLVGSASNPVLQVGTNYWLAASTTGAGTHVTWEATDVGGDRSIAINGGPWSVGSPTNNLAAFRLLASGTTLTWINNPDWDVAANWSPNLIPTPLDDVVLNDPFQRIIGPSVNAFANNVALSGLANLDITGGSLTTGSFDNSADGTFNLDGGTLTVQGGAFTPNSGVHPNNDLIIANGVSQFPHLVLDSGATAVIADDTFIGADSGNFSANLTVSGGSTISNEDGFVGSSDGLGVVTVSGTDGAGTPSQWVNSGDLTIGGGNFPDTGTGFLTIDGGAQVASDDGIVGSGDGSSGFVTLSGTDGAGNPSKWVNANTLIIGDNGGRGVLVIEDGGEVTNSIFGATIGRLSGAPSTVTVSGTDGSGNRSKWINDGKLVVGQSGFATLRIEGGGEVSNTADFPGEDVAGLIGGRTAGVNLGNGSVTVTGTDGSGNPSRWINVGQLVVAEDQPGTLTIEDGGEVSNTTGFLGTSSVSDTGTATVTGLGSKWTNSVDLNVRPTGSLTILDDGLVEVVGALNVSGGTVTLDGGILKVDSTAVVVNNGTLNYVTGTFHLTDAGGYTVGANSGPIDQALGGATLILPSGGGLIVDQNLNVPVATSLNAIQSDVTADGIVNDALIIVSNGVLTTSTGTANNSDMVLIDTTVEGPVINAGGSTVTVLGTVDFNGLVSGPGDFFGPGTANFNGGMAPGASPAQVSFQSHVTLGSGNTLFAELASSGGVPGADFDQLAIGGDVIIDGTLDVSLIGGFTPGHQESFQVMTFGSRTGVFSSVIDSGLPNMLVVAPFYSATDVTLSIELLGDASGNGSVGPEDYTLWANAFGIAEPSYNNGDFSRNGIVGPEDYTLWANKFGTMVVGPESGPEALAEPVAPNSSLLGKPAVARSVVPEPSTFVLAIVGMIGLFYSRHGRR